MSPISSTFSHIVDLVPTLIILGGLLIYYKVALTIQIILLMPVLLLLILVFSLGIGMFLAPINARFRDVRHILPYFIQLGMFATPVIYPTSMFGGNSRIIRIFNPVAEAIEISRSAFFNTRSMDWGDLFLSFLFALLLFLIGLLYFRTQENSFVDIL